MRDIKYRIKILFSAAAFGFLSVFFYYCDLISRGCFFYSISFIPILSSYLKIVQVSDDGKDIEDNKSR